MQRNRLVSKQKAEGREFKQGSVYNKIVLCGDTSEKKGTRKSAKDEDGKLLRIQMNEGAWRKEEKRSPVENTEKPWTSKDQDEGTIVDGGERKKKQRKGGSRTECRILPEGQKNEKRNLSSWKDWRR